MINVYLGERDGVKGAIVEIDSSSKEFAQEMYGLLEAIGRDKNLLSVFSEVLTVVIKEMERDKDNISDKD